MRHVTWWLLTLLLMASPTLADDKTAAADGDAAASTSSKVDASAAEAAIRANAVAYVEAFNGRDAEAMAAMWSPEAVYISRHTGTELVGREAIAADIAAHFKEDDQSKLEVTIESVQFVSPNVAVENGTAKLIYPEGEPEVLNYSAVHVKRDGKWLLDRLTEDLVVVPDSNYEHLKELEWMIGNWVDNNSDVASVITECNWTRNQNFITRSFQVVIGDQSAMSGMQVIGWDPAEKTIRSWIFDSDGSFGEATWTRKEDKWFINQSGVLADGTRASSVNVLTRLDDDTCTWQSINRMVGGELLPNVDEVAIVRANP